MHYRFRKMNKKIKKLGIAGGILLTLFLFFWYENHHITVSYYTYQNEIIPEAFRDYRIVQISDLHNARFGKENRKLLAHLTALAPDMLVLTGDLVDGNRTNLQIAADFAQEACKLCPVYYVTGNHEDWLDASERTELLDALQNAGVTIMDDTVCGIEKDGGSFLLVGLADAHVIGGTLRSLTEELDSGQFTVLLAHEPQCIDNYSECGMDLVFTGHAHGGQFRLPFIGGVVAPDQGLFPAYTEGIHEMGDTTMVISRGLGNSVIPVRLFNDPEIVCVDLQ